MKFYYRVLNELNTEEKNFETIYNKAFAFKDSVMFEYSENMMIKTVTYAECEKDAKRIAYSLQNLLKEEYRHRPIGLLMPNSEKWAAVFFGLLMAGFKPLLLNTAAPESLIKTCLNHAGTDICITDTDREGMINAYSLTDEGEPEICFEDEIILCTSGTMGEPKLCAYNGKQIISQIITAKTIIKYTPEIKSYIDKSGKNLKVLTLLPFCHIYGLVANLLWFSVFGQTFVQLKDINPETITNTCRLHEVTHIFSPPLLWNTLEKTIRRTAKKEGLEKKLELGIKISSFLNAISPSLAKSASKKLFKQVHSKAFGSAVDYCISGGGSISKETLKLINGIGYFLTNGYGMTEVGITSLVLSRRHKKLASGSVGHPLPSAEYMIDEDGVLNVRGDSCFVASYRNGQRTARDTSEWFKTGDIFELTKDGYVFKGRQDDMINLENGERIGPDEIELNFKSEYIKSLCAFAVNEDSKDRIILIAEPVSFRADIIRMLSEYLIETNNSLPAAYRASKVLISKNALPVSLNAKVSRRRVKEGIMSGTISGVSAADRTNAELSEAINEAKKELLKDIISCFAEVIDNEAYEINENTSFVYDLAGNSMEYFLLLDKVAAKCGVKVDGALGLTTPGEFADYILEAERT